VLGLTNAPAVFFTLAASFEIEFGQKDSFGAAAGFGDTFGDSLKHTRGASFPVAATGYHYDLHIISFLIIRFLKPG
jgi:hypothetical protein